MKKLALSLFKSADEKLRSLGAKHGPKPASPYGGAQSSPLAPPVVITSFTPAPAVPPPPIPIVHETYTSTTTEFLSQQTFQIQPRPPQKEAPPPGYNPRLSHMAERRIQRQGRRDEANLTKSASSQSRDGKSVTKRRSRSEGPQGRRRMRNSMHEAGNRAPQQSRQASNARYSMYTQQRSDDDSEEPEIPNASDSLDSDDSGRKQWTKNPLHVRKTKHKNGNIENINRKSAHNGENGFSQDVPGFPQTQLNREDHIVPPPRNRKLFIYSEKENKPLSQKAKFQQKEERRKKRIDMTVTSDEECSPQSRISRLRQRAMMSTQLFQNRGSADDINMVTSSQPDIRGDHANLSNSNGFVSHNIRSDIRPSWEDSVRSAHAENDNRSSVGSHLSGQFYDNYTKQQGVAKNMAPTYSANPSVPVPASTGRTLPIQTERDHMGYRPVRTAETAPSSGSMTYPGSIPQGRTVQSGQSRAAAFPQVKPAIAQKPNMQKLQPSDSPQFLRSFHEVKPSQPQQLKKAVERIELNRRSPNSSSDDSLDDLIESNIQYLESEIESGKLKRQSGNFTNFAPSQNVAQRPMVKETGKSKPSAHDEIRLRLQGPLTSQSVFVPPTAHVEPPRVIHRSQTYTPPASSSSIAQFQNTVPKIERTNAAGQFSPYTQRRTAELGYMDDLSKSDSQLSTQGFRQDSTQSFAPYPILNQQTGNIVYVQPNPNSEQPQNAMSLSMPAVDGGMFSDVDYDIEVSERIKKWEKKFTGDEHRASVLNTIQENETVSDSGIPEARLVQSYSRQSSQEARPSYVTGRVPPPSPGVSRLSVNLTKSTSSISDSHQTSPDIVPYWEPKVVSSETNLHRIFRVVQKPTRPHRTADNSLTRGKAQQDTQDHYGRQPVLEEPESNYSQSMSNVTLSESELGSSMQQSWPPMSVDSDSGVRKSWRTSRYEDELTELKEMVSDNFSDLKKRFNADVSDTEAQKSEPEIQRPVSPTRPIPRYVKEKWDKGPPVRLDIESHTPKTPLSPIPVRRTTSEPQKQTPTPSTRSSIDTSTVEEGDSNKPDNLTVDSKQCAVWSPNMTSRKGLVSIERVKARTLQTIPFSDDPVWKEIEGMTSFDRSALLQEEAQRQADFSDIEALLELATADLGASDAKSNIDSTHSPDTPPVSPGVVTMVSKLDAPALKAVPIVPVRRARIMSDSSVSKSNEPKKDRTFPAPAIQPLKLKINTAGAKTSASALDEVLEDIRSSLQKKPLSPKIVRNVETSDSNSSTNISLQSPLSKSSKSFNFARQDPPTLSKAKVGQTVSMETQPSIPTTWQQTQQVTAAQIAPNAAMNVPYIDPEFTQFPYIINGNYHLDPTLLSEKLKSTGLVAESSDEQLFHQKLKAQQSAPQTAPKRSSNTNQPGTLANQSQNQHNRTNTGVEDLDQSVDELQDLAKEVELKLNQIKSKIVTADEERLDNILLALRKFAPMTEHRFFDVRFTPIESKVKRTKLEDALSELERVYESLELDDKDLLSRAERRENTVRRPVNQSGLQRTDNLQSSSQSQSMMKPERYVERRPTPQRTEQVADVERQTQNEFEDITKSFQVLLDEVTKQCRSVAQGSTRYASVAPPLFVSPKPAQPSTLPPKDEIRREPPRPQLKVETSRSQRTVKQGFTPPVKATETVAIGTNTKKQPSSSSVYVALQKDAKADQAKTRSNVSKITTLVLSPPATPVLPPRNLEIVLQSKATPVTTNRPVVTMATNPSSSGSSVSKATRGPAVSTSTGPNVSKAPEVQQKRFITRKNESESKQSRPGGRFRRRNVEHRKSMPSFTRTVETQTVETQTETPPSNQNEAEENADPEVAQGSKVSQDTTSDSPLEDPVLPTKLKLSRGVAKMVDLFSSSEEERGRESKLSHSHSAPDIMALFNDRDEGQVTPKTPKIDKPVGKSLGKAGTPRSVKQRHEARLKTKSSQKDDVDPDRSDDVMLSSVTSEDGSTSPKKTKPPVYPPRTSQKVDSPQKSDKKSSFAFDRDFTKVASDSEKDKHRPAKKVPASQEACTDTEIVRRRTRSVGSEQQECAERPRSFHELVATFESDPQRLEKLKTSGLRKCASENSMVTDFVLQKMYFSETELRRGTSGDGLNRSGSGLMLAVELKMTSDK